MRAQFKLASEVRKKILQKVFSSSPEREALLKKAEPLIEEIANEPTVKRLYLAGSSASKKVAPSDIDLIARRDWPLSNAESGAFFDKYAPYMPDMGMVFKPEEKKAPLHLITEDSLKGFAPKEYMKEGKKRYGENYKWLRIASILAALEAMRVVKKEKGKEKDKED